MARFDPFIGQQQVPSLRNKLLKWQVPSIKNQATLPDQKTLQATLVSTQTRQLLGSSPLRSSHVWAFSAKIHSNLVMFNLDLLRFGDFWLRFAQI